MDWIKTADVILVGADKGSWVSRRIAKVSGGWASHVAICGPNDLMVEATFPFSRIRSLSEYLLELEKKGRRWEILRLEGAPQSKLDEIWRHATLLTGRWYDVAQLFIYLVTMRFWNDGPGTLVCTRLVSEAYKRGGLPLFPEDHIKRQFPYGYPRIRDLRKGWLTPCEFGYSLLRRVTPPMAMGPHVPRQVRRAMSRMVANRIVSQVGSALNDREAARSG